MQILLKTESHSLSVCQDHRPCKMAEPILMQFEILTMVGQGTTH